MRSGWRVARWVGNPARLCSDGFGMSPEHERSAHHFRALRARVKIFLNGGGGCGRQGVEAPPRQRRGGQSERVGERLAGGCRWCRRREEDQWVGKQVVGAQQFPDWHVYLSPAFDIEGNDTARQARHPDDAGLRQSPSRLTISISVGITEHLDRGHPCRGRPRLPASSRRRCPTHRERYRAAGSPRRWYRSRSVIAQVDGVSHVRSCDRIGHSRRAA